jgi:hypothetical protein
MLEADNKPLKKNINSVIMKSKKSLKLLLLVTVLLMMTTWRLFTKAINGSRQHVHYFYAERQYFVKIQRGKIDAESYCS